MMKRQAKDLGWRCLTLYLPLILFLVGTLFPFYWIVNTSLKDSVEVLSLPIKYWPEHPTLSNYLYLFEKMGVHAWFDYWGYDVAHDWCWWRRQLPYFLNFLLDY